MIYTVLIVDDEKVIRNGIVNGNPWSKWGFQVVGQACDGLEAIELIERLHPQVVLSDIRMPNYDGVQLMAYINQNHPSIKLVILSGYKDFEYLNQSIKNNVCDYLLKPTLEEDFEDLFLKLKLKLDEEREEQAYIRALKWAEQLMKINDCIMGIEALDSDSKACLPEMGYVSLWAMEDTQREQAFQALKDFSKSHQGIFYRIMSETMIGITKETPKTIHEHIQVMHPSLSVGVSQKHTNETFHEAYQEAKKALDLTRFRGMGYYICYQDEKSRVTYSSLIQEVLTLLDTSFTDNAISLDYIGEKVDKNPSYISKLFKKETGYNVSAYITKKRMEEAVVLLKDITNKIYEISDALGFADPSNFIRIFKKTYGVSPNEYRERGA